MYNQDWTIRLNFNKQIDRKQRVFAEVKNTNKNKKKKVS